MENIKELILELIKDGFTKAEIEEIIAYVQCGGSIDAAIQSIL